MKYYKIFTDKKQINYETIAQIQAKQMEC